jgi:copper chaperone CopZ
MSAKIPPKPTKDTIYVDVDDEITSIIDKVENSPGKVVALVLPKRAATLQSTVNMKLLKRSADNAGKNVVLITSEAALIPLAGAAELHVAKNLQSIPEIPDAPTVATMPAAQDLPAEDVPEPAEELDNEEELPGKIDYSRPIGALAAKHEAENPETIDLEDEDDTAVAKTATAAKASKSSKLKVPNFDRFRMMLGLGAVGLVALIVFIFLALFVLPKATITIHTTSEPVTANFNLTATAGAALDPAKWTIPAKLESMDQTGTQSVTATGQQNNGDKASGNVSMTAQECAPNLGTPSDVPSGTGISSNGLNYITQKNTTFVFTGFSSGSCANYSSSSSTAITAQAGGSKYNISGATFKVAGRSDVSASGSASGGSDNVVTVLSQSDVDGAKQKLATGATADTFTKSFEDKLANQGEYVFISTLKAGDPNITATPAVGQPASTASVVIKITYSVLAVQKSDLSKIIQAKTASQIDLTKQKLNGSFLNDASITVQSQPAPNSAILAVNENTTAVPIIDVASVKKTATGHKVGDIKAALGNLPGVQSIDVKLSPFWVSKAPKTSKIVVNLQEVKSSSNNSAP